MLQCVLQCVVRVCDDSTICLERTYHICLANEREREHSVLQCVAVCCSVLQCVLQRVAVCCSVLQCVAVCCSVLQCDILCCSVCCSVLLE